MSDVIKPQQVPEDFIGIAEELFEEGHWSNNTKVNVARFLNAAIEAGIVRPTNSTESVLMRAVRLMHFSLYDEKVHVPMAGDIQNYIRQAESEIAKESAK